MNNLAKNMLLWLVIAIVLMSVFNNFGNRPTAARAVDYSQFYANVNDGKVDRVMIEGRKITGTLKGGESFTTYSPETDNRALVGDLLKNGVTVEGKAPEEQSLLLTIFINWFPMLL